MTKQKQQQIDKVVFSDNWNEDGIISITYRHIETEEPTIE